MNNDAFRALVNQKRKTSDGGAKSTKEIAREAVEDEFERKRRRGGGGRRGGRRGGGYDDYGSDSGGSSDDGASSRDGRKREGGGDDDDAKGDDDGSLPEWKRRRREKRKAGGGGGEGVPEYRDRARERREGKNSDYASLQGLAAPSGELDDDDRARQVELSKYLGGDEEHTHLVKGLDRQLAEKVRREEMGLGSPSSHIQGGGGDGDLDQLLEDTYARRDRSKSAKSATNWRTAKPKSELGDDMLRYLLEREEAKADGAGGAASQAMVSAASQSTRGNAAMQRSLRRTVLTFSLNSDVRRRDDAWEVPRAISRSFGAGADQTEVSGRMMMPLNQHMISTISKRLDEAASKERERSRYRANGNGRKGDGAGEGPAACDAKSNAAGDGQPPATKDDDSDDDIFADAGAYVPEALVVAKSTNDPPGDDGVDKSKGGEHADGTQKKEKQAKQSIFDNLIPETDTTTRKNAQMHKSTSQVGVAQFNRKSEKKDVIDRDVFGGKRSEDPGTRAENRRRGPKSAAKEGVSMTSYGGGYGEEMDVDFGGHDDDVARRRKGRGGDDEGGDDRADMNGGGKDEDVDD